MGTCVKTAVIALSVLGFLVAGCTSLPRSETPLGRRRNNFTSPSDAASPTASPTPKPTPSVIAATQGLQLTVLDRANRPVLQMRAETASVDPAQNKNTILVNNGKATLYQEGKPTATLTADKLTANRAARTLVATGHVRVVSLAEKSAPTVTADTMTWEHDTNLLRGQNNVIITAEPAYRLFADSFIADTEISKFTLQMGNQAATGTY